MSFETDLRAKLKAGLTEGVYWKTRPQGSALPAVVLEMVFGSRDQNFGGVISAQGPRIQVRCIAGTKKEAAELRDKVMPLLEAPGTQGATYFQSGFVNFYRDGVENTPTGEIYSEIIDANIWFN